MSLSAARNALKLPQVKKSQMKKYYINHICKCFQVHITNMSVETKACLAKSWMTYTKVETLKAPKIWSDSATG